MHAEYCIGGFLGACILHRGVPFECTLAVPGEAHHIDVPKPRELKDELTLPKVPVQTGNVDPLDHVHPTHCMVELLPSLWSHCARTPPERCHPCEYLGQLVNQSTSICDLPDCWPMGRY